MHKENTIIQGVPLGDSPKALVLVHGRGATAHDILSVAAHLNVKDYTLVAPQATNNSWYPLSFMAPASANEPWLSSALETLEAVVHNILQSGLERQHIYFLGFSQGACLTLEFIARHANRYGGVVAFTGGLIGDKIDRENYKGQLEQTPIFIGTSNPDFHVPVERVYATSNILKEMGGDVTEKIYPNMGHTIIEDEITTANKLIFK